MSRSALRGGVFALACAAAPAHAREPVWVGRFSQGMAEWSEAKAAGTAQGPNIRIRDWDGVAAVEFRAERAMVLLEHAIADERVRSSPVLCWRWRVDAPVATADWEQRRGDDFAARVYLGLRSPEQALSALLRARLRLARALWGERLPDAALNYVWDNRHPVGAQRANAYTERTRMIVAESGTANAGRWVEERADVGRDAAAWFGESARFVLLAIASDTDDTGESARAGFADLHFAARDEACQFPPSIPR